jgi:hypothetical protein
MTPEQEKALHDALDRRAGQLATLKRSRAHRIMRPQLVGDNDRLGPQSWQSRSISALALRRWGKCALSLLLSSPSGPIPLSRSDPSLGFVGSRQRFVRLRQARRAGTLHQPTSDNSRSGDPHQIRQRIRARSEIVTHWPMIIAARPPSWSFMGHPHHGLGEASSLLIEHDGLIRFEERPLDHRLRQSVPLQCLIIEPHHHFELSERCLPKVLV